MISIESPFPHEAELKEKSARLAELNTLLNLDKKDNEIADEDKADDIEVREQKEKDRDAR